MNQSSCLKLLHKCTSVYKFSNGSYSSSIFIHTLRKCLLSNASNTLSTGGTKKGFLVYHNLKFNPWIPRVACGVGVFALGMAVHVADGLSNLALTPESEVSDQPANLGSKLYSENVGKYLPYVYSLTGVVLLFFAKKFVNGVVKKLLLDVDRKNVTFVSYKLFGKEIIKTFPVKDVMFTGSKVKIKNHSSSYFLMTSGSITNKTLFNFALNNQKIARNA